MSATIKVSMPRRAFVAPITVSHRHANISAMATTYKVTFVNKEGQEKTVDCRDDDYILDAADAGGVDLPASCRGT
jgi:2Fe-2S iron-sulfur cluster binding domain